MTQTGRKTKLTSELQKQICDLIKRGNYTKTACLAVGIDESCYYKWIKRGEEAKTGIYFQFVQSIKRVQEEAKVRYLERIREAADNGNWTAAAWFLERKYPDEWGKKEKHTLEGKMEQKHSGKIDLNIDLRKLSDAELEKIYQNSKE